MNVQQVDYQLPHKFEPFTRPKRFKVAKGGRDSAKSWTIAQLLLLEGASRQIRVGCFREVQKSLKDSVYTLLKDQIQRLGLSDFYSDTRDEIRGANGTLFVFSGLSLQTKDSLKSFEGLDYAWVEEAHSVSQGSWDVLTPTIRKPGSEIWISFNPDMDTDPVYEMFVAKEREDTLVVSINWYDNPWKSDALDSEREQMKRDNPEKYSHIYEGQCAPAVEGAIYYNELAAATKASRIGNVPYDPMLKVHTVWDLGYNDKVAIIFVQRVASEIRVINYLEDNLKDLPWYANELKKLEYNWGKDYLPHDGYAGRLEGGGKSTYQILKALGRPVVPKGTMPNIDVEEGIKQARLVFPRVYFDKDKAHVLLDHLKRYKRSIPMTTREPGSPVHDAASHGSDAFRYLSLVADKLRNEADSPKLVYEVALA